MPRTRFSRWDGTQDPFAGDFDIASILDEISDDLLSGYGAEFALRRLMRRGIQGQVGGLDQLRERIKQMRKRMERGLNLEGPLAEVRDRLNEIVAQERSTLQPMQNEDARMREAFLDSLPPQPGQQLRELQEYRFVDPEAQQKFDQLVEEIRQQILSSYFKNLSGAIQGIDREQLQRMREMMQALNAMVAAHERGEPYDFEGFMREYGDFFPENPRNLEELLEILARRMAAMSRLLASMSPEQRRQLQELVDAVMQDLDLAFQMDQLSQELRQLMPHLPWDEPAMGMGDEPMQFSTAISTLERMGELEELEETMRGDYLGSHIDDVDEEKLQRALGENAVQDLRRLKEIEKVLEEAGILARNRGRLQLTARGARRIGERALVKVFEDLNRDRPGPHDSREAGGLAEPTGATRPWRFGETGEFAVQKTVFNAVLRSVGTGERREATSRVKVTADDFELIDAETRTRTATALLLDMSYSMPLRGNWLAAKRMALALHALIEGKYPQDRLYLIGFSDYARKLEIADLTATDGFEPVYGTNMQHAFLMARRLLAEHARATKQVIMVTDGEPTAHLMDTPQGPKVFFSWPPVQETIHKTLAEAIRLSNASITLNVFMLEDAPGLVRFMQTLAQRTGGRVFQTTGRELGSFVLRDYVRRRRTL